MATSVTEKPAMAEAVESVSGRVTGAPRWGMAIDLKRCTGCQSCTMACKAENGTPPGVFWMRVLEKEEGAYPLAYTVFMPLRCNHCSEPPCVPVCPTGASYVRRYCMLKAGVYVPSALVGLDMSKLKRTDSDLAKEYAEMAARRR